MNMPEEERIKELKLLKSSYEMYEKSKKDTETKMKQKMKADGSPVYTPAQIKEKLDLIQGMEDDVVDQYKSLGGNMDELTKKKTTRAKAQKTVMDIVNEKPEVKPRQVETPSEPITKPATTETVAEQTPTNGAIYDVIPLPSGGECYPNKMGKVKVAYLTAYDENILVSPNLYRDNKVLDEILKHKMINCPIAPENLLMGDRDAIILWLRATGYGNDFPITATDNDSGKQFEANIDLSKIKFKPFNLKGDENGFFDFETPVTHDKIKFRFLTSGDNEYLDELNEEEKKKSVVGKLERICKDLSDIVSNDKTLGKDEKKKVFDAQNALNAWKDKLLDSGEEDIPFTNIITNRMQLMTMEVNGNRDRQFIYKYIMGMNVRDAAAYRRYVSENEPGLDFNLEVERPESLGGGTVNVFLQLDQYLFFNIAE
jgi:hypothetical protein